ncbi:MAG: hypothetical protein VKK04_26150 [Synechococcales bacterium]|nr:hypothetical protein [Synechococcales bacterium]
MKRHHLIIGVATVLALTSLGATTLAQQSNSPETFNPQDLQTTDIEVDPYELPDPATDPDWQAEFRGIDLSPEQVNRILELKETLDREAFGSNPASVILGLLEMADAGEQGDREFNQSSLADAIRNYNTGIRELLTPEQYQQYVENAGSEPPVVPQSQNGNPTMASHSQEQAELLRWEDEMVQIYFEEWFEGIELTPEQEQVVRAEIRRYHRTLNPIDNRSNQPLTDERWDEILDEFFARLEPTLSSEQIQQVKNNQQGISEG